METSLLINYGVQAPPEDQWWLTIEVKVADDRLTMEQAAEVVDELYHLDPCVAAPEVPEAVAPAELEPVDLLNAVVKVIHPEECALLLSGDYRAEVKIIRSHPGSDYNLKLSAGTFATVLVREEVVLTLNVAEDSSLLLPFPVLSGLRASWMGTVYNRKEGAVTPPIINASHNTIFWSGEVSGTIRVSYQTEYDLVTVDVPGVMPWAGALKGEPQDSAILVFYHYQTYADTITPPPVDEERYAALRVEMCGAFPGSWQAQEEEDEPVLEPPEVVDPCFDPNEDLADLEYYKGHCCAVPTFPLPDCEAWVGGHKPGKGLSQATMDRYTAGHSGPVSFIGIGNPGPEACGEIIYRIDVEQKNCCIDVLPMQEDPLNPDEISPGGRVRMCVLDGGKPKKWEVGGGLFFDGGLTSVTTDWNCMWVNAPEKFCSRSGIAVTDSCKILTMALNNPEALPLAIADCGLLSVAPGGYIEITVGGGVKPYQYSANGLEHIQGAYFRAPMDGCGTASVTVTDACAELVACPVQITSGKWERQYPDQCHNKYSSAGGVRIPAPCVTWQKIDATVKLQTHIMLSNNYVSCKNNCEWGNDLGSCQASCEGPGVEGEWIGGSCWLNEYNLKMAEGIDWVYEWVC